MALFDGFGKKNSPKLKLFVIVAVFFVGIASTSAYLFVRFSHSNSELPNLTLLPSVAENGSDSIEPDLAPPDTIAQDPVAPDAVDQDPVVLGSELSSAITNEIKMLYPTKENGRVWNAKWSNGNKRTLKSGQRDPFDSEFIARGNVAISIDGRGVAQFQGSAPRMYVYDSAKNKKWNNVEVTVYAKRISETGKESFQGIVIGARSEHQDATLKNPCLGATYYGRLLYDGRAVFQKEVIHEGAYSTNKPTENNKAKWGTKDGTMPKNVWIGVKFIVKTNPNGKSVKLELYRDLTDGYNGGTWEKVAEYTDSGDWSQTNSGADIQKECGYSANKILLKPGTSVFIRNDEVKNMELKSFSIREIK